MTTLLLVALEVLFVSVTIVVLYRMKARFGLAPLFVFVGSIQYLQTILATVFYIRVGDVSFSPGSAVLFSSSIFAILLVYIREGIPQARTLIYGIVLANIGLTVLSSITDLQINLLRGAVEIDAALSRLFVLNVRLFVVGTVTAALDAFLIVIAYEFLLFKVRGLRLFGRILVSMLCVLYFDSVVFTTGTFLGNPGLWNILRSQLVSKTFAGVLFSIVLWVYLGVANRKKDAFIENRSGEFRDVFSIITYQENYHRMNAARARAEAERERAVAETRAHLEETERSRSALLSILEDEQQTRDALRESEERFRTMVEASPIGIFLIGPDGGVTYGNPADRRMTGLSPEDILGTRWIKAIHPEDRDRTLAEWQVAMQRGEDYSGTGRYLHEDGTIVWWDVSTAAIRSGDSVLGQVGMVVDITSRRESETKLQLANDRLQALSHRLLEIQETERRQIARELHDEIGQVLTATKINLQSLKRYPEPATITDRLSESIGIVERALGQVRSLSLELRPPLLDDLGLAAALRWLADQHAHRTGLRVEFRSSAVDARFDAALETACFRVAQEALNNVVKHAGARHATVELQTQSDGLHLLLSDDGTGFDVLAARLRAAHGASLGLLGMEERATLAGGGIEWRSTPGKGTEVHAWFPLQQPARTGEEIRTP